MCWKLKQMAEISDALTWTVPFVKKGLKRGRIAVLSNEASEGNGPGTSGVRVILSATERTRCVNGSVRIAVG